MEKVVAWFSGAIREFIPVLLGITVLIAVRNYPVFSEISFWAEDADELFIGSLNLKLQSLITPIYGYHFLLSRALALLISVLPLAWAPFLYAATSMLINAFVVCYFSRDGFSWIIDSRRTRILVCALLALAPGSPEVFLNLINLSAPLSLLALLLFLEKPYPPKIFKISVFAVLVLSSGQIFLFTPVLIYFWYITRQNRYLYLLGIILPVTMLNIVGSHSIGTKAGLLNYDHVLSAPKIIWEQGFIRFIIAPFFGSKLTSELMKMPGILFWPVSIGVTGFFLKALIKNKVDRTKIVIFGLTYLCCAASFGVIAIARSYAFEQVSRESGYLAWNGRYSFLTGSVALLIWSSLLINSKFRFRKRLLAQAALLLIAINHLAHWNSRNLRPDPTFGYKAEQIQSALKLAKEGLLASPLITEKFQVGPYFYHHSRMTVLVHPDGSVTSIGSSDPPR